MNSSQAPAHRFSAADAETMGDLAERRKGAWAEAFWAVALIGSCLAIGYGAMAMISERALVIASIQ